LPHDPGHFGNPGDDKPRPDGRDWLLALALVFVTVLAFLPVWRAGFIWDDDVYVTDNPLLTASDGLRRIWFSLDSPSQYFPLTYTTFYLERLLWGFHPAGYHAVNLLLHAANALLVWRLLARLRLPGAWLAAALFALHPVQVESVAWITERKNVLMGFFFLLSLLAWTKFLEESGQSPRRPGVSEGEVKGRAGSPLPAAARAESASCQPSPSPHPWRYYGLALLCYALALCAKTTACTLPAALLLVLWLKKMPIGWRRWAQAGPFVALGIGMGLVTVWWERFHQGTQGTVFSIGPVERVLIASRALWFYAGKLLWPARLTFSYPRWTISASDPSAYVWLLLTLALGVGIWRGRRRLGRGVEVAAVFFAATLSPVLGFIMLWTFVFSFVADHYQYLACLGPLALAAAGIERGLGWAARRSLILKPIGCAVLLTILGSLTWAQCGQYADAETLWGATLARNPASWLAHNELGLIRLDQGKLEEAEGEFKMTLALHPDDEKAHNNLALISSRKGDIGEAIAHFRKSLDIQPADAKALGALGTLLLQQGQVAEAITEFRKALALQPAYSQARGDLGRALLRQGDFDGALACFGRTAAPAPDSAQQWHDIGEEFLNQGFLIESAASYRRALSINPRFADAWAGLGLASLQNGQFKEAEDSWQKVLDINPAEPQIQNNLASLLATASDAALRDGPRAVALAEQASQATGGANPIILCTLAAAYAETGRYQEAVATARKALSQAQAQKNDKLAGALQEQIKLYEAGRPTRQAK
jgi:tetratricopeptide (TPR) repeat protein